MTKTLREKFIEGLQARGEKEVKRTPRKIVYSRKEGGFFYLGSSGSLRFGYTSTNSIPCSVKFKVQLLGIEGTI